MFLFLTKVKLKKKIHSTLLIKLIGLLIFLSMNKCAKFLLNYFPINNIHIISPIAKRFILIPKTFESKFLKQKVIIIFFTYYKKNSRFIIKTIIEFSLFKRGKQNIVSKLT